MQLELTGPLIVRPLQGGKLELLPVRMEKLPTWKPAVFTGFLKPQGQRIALTPRDIDAVQAYMRQYSTDAVSEDGLIAFTLSQDGLLECLPDTAEQLFDELEDSHADLDC